MAALDLLLINPCARTGVYQRLGAELAAVEPPVWSGLIAEYVRRKGCSVEVLDAEAEDLGPEQVAERVEQAAPRLVGMIVYGHQPSASTQTMPAAGRVCNAIKQRTPEQKILIAGTHPSALPEQTLREENVDYVCDGEGPITIVSLIEKLKEKTSTNGDYSKVGSLWYRDGSQPRRTAPTPLIKDLDTEMPGLAWDLLPMPKYRAHNWHTFGHLKRLPYASLYTTLGCPYHCTFCCIQAPFKNGEKALEIKETTNSYRYWSPKSVIAQLDTLVNQYGVRNVKIADEMFVLNRKHILGICDLIIERGYDLNIWAYARVDTVKDDMLDKLKRAGFNWLAFGIESGSARVRDEADKAFDQEDIFRTIGKVRDTDINVIGNYIFGLPEDDFDSMDATLKLSLELNAEFANFYSAMAYPGSPLYRMALEQNWKLPETWSGYSQHSVDCLPLPTKYLSASDVLRFRDHSFDVYFSSPSYLSMASKKFGAETAEHIREMATHKLERKFARPMASAI
jgi:radical SAM superfamily enzyme YgiQ (UPF0313 family)